MSWGIWVGIALALLMAAGASVWFFARQPTLPARMNLSTGAHAETPVVPVRIAINDSNLNGALKALSTGWQDGLGASSSLVNLPRPRNDTSEVTFDLLWVELFSQRAYVTNFALPISMFDQHQLSEPYLSVILLFGSQGELQVRTQPQHGMAGASRLVHSTCAEREPVQDIDFTDPTNDALVFPEVLHRRGGPEAETLCTSGDE